MWIKFHFKLGPISITKSGKIRVTFLSRISGSWKFFSLCIQKWKEGPLSFFFFLPLAVMKLHRFDLQIEPSSMWKRCHLYLFLYRVKYNQKLHWSISSLFFISRLSLVNQTVYSFCRSLLMLTTQLDNTNRWWNKPNYAPFWGRVSKTSTENYLKLTIHK